MRRGQRRAFALLLGTAVVAASLACSGPDRSHGSAQRGGVTPPNTAISRSTQRSRGPIKYSVHVPPGPAGPLASNTCVGFGPSNPTGAATIFLDPGHGGHDPGTQSGSTAQPTEKQLTLTIGLEVRDRLVRDGHTVVMSRITDTNVSAVEPGDLSGGAETPEYLHRDLLARNECANASGAGAIVGIHFDADADPSAVGTETIYCAQRPFAASNLQLAALIQDDVVASVRHTGFDLSSRGAPLNDHGVGGALTAAAHAYGHLVLLGPASQPENPTPTTMPGALVEPLFLTNPAEAAYVASPVGRHAIAAGITNGIETFLREPHRAATSWGGPLEHHPA